MKTSISTHIKFSILTIFVLLGGIVYGQKSINYQSVGSQLEEITSFVDDSCKKADKISTVVINDLEMFVKKTTNSETMAKINDWSEIQLKELNEAAMEAKVWLSKQHFAPVKYSKKSSKDLAKKD